jgi:putative oxidoreductase
MNLRRLRLDSLARYERFAAVPVRLLLGHRLIHSTQDNVFSHERMVDFADFLGRKGFPAPMAMAHLSAYAQFICGILILLGLFVRPAAAVMIINFVVALVMVHWGQPYDRAFDALAMFAGSIFLLLNGAGRPSVDAWMAARSAASVDRLPGARLA